jgi:hypothetical protein
MLAFKSCPSGRTESAHARASNADGLRSSSWALTVSPGAFAGKASHQKRAAPQTQLPTRPIRAASHAIRTRVVNQSHRLRSATGCVLQWEAVSEKRAELDAEASQDVERRRIFAIGIERPDRFGEDFAFGNGIEQRHRRAGISGHQANPGWH